MELIQRILIIGLGGFVGANARYWVSGWAADRFGATFPWGTLIINISGSCLLGIFLGWVSNHINVDPRVRLLVATGFFGAYTTFSTYANESIAMLQAGNWIGGLWNVLGTNLLCLAGALVGLLIATRWL
jgi:CrcB protein